MRDRRVAESSGRLMGFPSAGDVTLIAFNYLRGTYGHVDSENGHHQCLQTYTNLALRRNHNTALPSHLLLLLTQPHDSNKHIVRPLKCHLRPKIPMLPLPRIPQRQQNRKPTHHHARVVHRSHADGHRIREHEDDVEDDDVGACDGEDDGAVGGGDVELEGVRCLVDPFCFDEAGEDDLPVQDERTSST